MLTKQEKLENLRGARENIKDSIQRELDRATPDQSALITLFSFYDEFLIRINRVLNSDRNEYPFYGEK